MPGRGVVGKGAVVGVYIELGELAWLDVTVVIAELDDILVLVKGVNVVDSVELADELVGDAESALEYCDVVESAPVDVVDELELGLTVVKTVFGDEVTSCDVIELLYVVSE